MATVPDPTDPGTRRLNEKPITKPHLQFTLLQYTPRALEICVPVPLDNVLGLFQLFFSDKQIEIIAKNTNKTAQLGEPQPVRLAQGGRKNHGGLLARPA